MVVAKLGPSYKAKSCVTVPKQALEMIEMKPSSYRVWVDTKGHMGELRGALSAGMVQSSQMEQGTWMDEVHGVCSDFLAARTGDVGLPQTTGRLKWHSHGWFLSKGSARIGWRRCNER